MGFRRSAAVAVTAIVGTLACPGVAGASGSSPGISDTCTNPTFIHEGFVASRTAFFRVRVQPAPASPETLWICYRAKSGATDVAGRIDVHASRVTDLVPDRDTNSRACTSQPGNQAPGDHPIQDGGIGPLDLFLDVFQDASAVWVCLEVSTVKLRVAVPLSGLDDPIVDLTTDPSPAQPEPTMEPQPGLPSSRCYYGANGGGVIELVNTDHGPEHLFVFASSPALQVTHLCARVHGGPRPAGVDIGLNINPGNIVALEQYSDLTPCTERVVDLDPAQLWVFMSPPGVSPPSICVGGPGLPKRRYTIRTLSGDPTPVSVAVDP